MSLVSHHHYGWRIIGWYRLLRFFLNWFWWNTTQGICGMITTRMCIGQQKRVIAIHSIVYAMYMCMWLYHYRYGIFNFLLSHFPFFFFFRWSSFVLLLLQFHDNFRRPVKQQSIFFLKKKYMAMPKKTHTQRNGLMLRCNLTIWKNINWNQQAGHGKAKQSKYKFIFIFHVVD